MSRINSNNSTDQSLNFGHNFDKSSLLKVPHYSLQDVEFVEELGEGAFGNVTPITNKKKKFTILYYRKGIQGSAYSLWWRKDICCC